MTVTRFGPSWFGKRVVWTAPWTSDGAGAASVAIPNAEGMVNRVVTVPDAVDAPDDNYTLTVTDTHGIDILNGLGVNRDTANPEHLLPVVGTDAVPMQIQGGLTVTIAAAGAANKGTVYIYMTL